jgi:phage protein D/phage baseplate assembly protein gpV
VPEERRLAQVALTVNGKPLPAESYDVLTSIWVEESAQLPDAFVVRFADPNFELFDRMEFTFGSKLDIAFSGEGSLTTVTHGEVTAVSVEQGPTGLHELVLQGMDATHRLAKSLKTRSFQQVTDADIASQIAGEYSLTCDVDPTGEIYEYVLQSNLSDYAFLKQRADRIGFDMWIAEGSFHFKPSPASAAAVPVLRWGENLRKFKVRFSAAERCDEVTVRGWDPVAKRTVLGRATEGDTGTGVAVAKELADAARSAFGRVSRFSGHYPVATQREAENMARSLLLKCSGDEVIARGEAQGDPLIAAGATVTVENMGQRLSGTYRVTSVEHLYGTTTEYLTRFVCGGKEPGRLAELLTGAGSGGSVKGNGWGSLVVGIVTNSQDPDKLGRVRVKYPTLNDSDESAWAKVVAPGAGAKRGLECLPEVGDEVLVGFEHDDVRRPVVFGGLWNTNDAPPDDAIKDGQVAKRTWTSRNGHRIELSDDESEGAVHVTLGDSSSALTLKRSESQVTGEQKLAVEGQDVVISARGSLSLKAPKIDIEAAGEVKVSGAIIRLN